MIQVLLVDDHGVVRAGLRRLIEEHKDMQVAAEAESGEQSVRMYQEFKPDAVVMDLSMPGIGGLDAIRQILTKDKNAKVLVVSAYTDVVWSRKVLESGAQGLLSKGCPPSVFLDALTAVALGRAYIEQSIAQELAFSTLSGNQDPIEDLTDREFEIFRMLAEGRSSRNIAHVLKLSPKTISTYQSHVFEKLDIDNIAALTRLAIQKGIVSV